MTDQNKNLEVLNGASKAPSVFSTDNNYSRALDVAKQLSSSDLVPDTYRNKPSNCLIALDIARQVCSSPLIVMQNLHIIKGKPSWSSTYIAGAIKSRYKNIKVILDGQGDSRGCKVVAYSDSGEVLAEGVRVTIGMAKAEGWFQKTGSKWKTMPDLMLQYRANAFFGRVHCPDVLIGLKSEYEIMDIEAKAQPTPVIDPFKTDITPSAEEPAIVENDAPVEILDETPPDDMFDENACSNCGTKVSEKVKKYSTEKFGEVLCYDCQKAQKEEYGA